MHLRECTKVGHPTVWQGLVHWGWLVLSMGEINPVRVCKICIERFVFLGAKHLPHPSPTPLKLAPENTCPAWEHLPHPSPTHKKWTWGESMPRAKSRHGTWGGKSLPCTTSSPTRFKVLVPFRPYHPRPPNSRFARNKQLRHAYRLAFVIFWTKSSSSSSCIFCVYIVLQTYTHRLLDPVKVSPSWWAIVLWTSNFPSGTWIGTSEKTIAQSGELESPQGSKIVYLGMAPISYLASFVWGWFRRANE